MHFRKHERLFVPTFYPGPVKSGVYIKTLSLLQDQLPLPGITYCWLIYFYIYSYRTNSPSQVFPLAG